MKVIYNYDVISIFYAKFEKTAEPFIITCFKNIIYSIIE